VELPAGQDEARPVKDPQPAPRTEVLR